MNAKRKIAAALVFIALLAGLPAARVFGAAEVISPTGDSLTVDVSKGIIVRLDHPCSSVFVADPSVADVQLKSPSVLYILGKAAGETTIYAVDREDNVLLDSRVSVRQDVDRLQKEIEERDPKSHVNATAVDDSIVLEGTLASAAEGDDIRKIAARYVAGPEQLVNKMTLDAPNQVNLQVRVAEIQRSVLKQFGINWQNVIAANGTAFGIMSANPALVGGVTASGELLGAASSKVVPLLPGQSALAASSSSTTTVLGLNGQDSTLIGNATNNNLFVGGERVNAVIDALAQNGLITVLAEPNLTTVSGQKASFLAGGEFPVPVPQTGGGNSAAITIDWKQFGVSLDFTPTILGNGRIGLHVAPEVSELAPQDGITLQGVTVPGITTRKADTTVELGSGQSFAIAGLLQNTTQQELQSYPWIGDLPILGALFRSTAFQRGESELVIIVTPYIVQPVSSAVALKTPMDGYKTPTDASRVMNGALNTPASPPAPTAPTTSPAAIRPVDAVADTTAPAAGVPLQPVSSPAELPPLGAEAAATPAQAAPLPIAAANPAPQPKAPAAKPKPGAEAGFEID